LRSSAVLKNLRVVGDTEFVEVGAD